MCYQQLMEECEIQEMGETEKEDLALKDSDYFTKTTPLKLEREHGWPA